MLEGEPETVASLLGTRLVSSESLAGGYSHETCLLTCTDARFVVRFGGERPDIEASVMRAAATDVPVPAVVLVQPPGGEHSRGFIVLEFVEGRLLEHVLDGAADDVTGLGLQVGSVAGRISRRRFDAPGFFADDDLTVPPERPWSEQLPDVAVSSMEHTDRLSRTVGARWVRLCTERAGDLRAVDGTARLVHSDLNPKNLLVRHDRHGWRVAAVLDWEFGYSGCPYADPANMARFGAEYPAGFLGRFRAGFAEQQPDLAPAWTRIGRVLDMFALSNLVTRPAGNPIADRAAGVIRDWVHHGVPDS